MNNMKRDHIIIFIASYWIVALYICRMHMDGVSYSAVGFFFSNVRCHTKIPAFIVLVLWVFLSKWDLLFIYLFPFWRRILFHFFSFFFLNYFLLLFAVYVFVCMMRFAFCASTVTDSLQVENRAKKMQRKKICRNYA